MLPPHSAVSVDAAVSPPEGLKDELQFIELCTFNPPVAAVITRNFRGGQVSKSNILCQADWPW